VIMRKWLLRPLAHDHRGVGGDHLRMITAGLGVGGDHLRMITAGLRG
jgi:hypothetical protein